MSRPIALLLVLATAFAPTAARASPPYRGGAVATAHPRATRAAISMLAKGGNAVDAAVAAAFVLAVVGPYHSSLGGGGFALWYAANKKTTRALDFREVAPAAATRDMFLRDGKPAPQLATDGGLAVAVPGAIAGLLQLHREGGRLPRAEVIAPAIGAARDGFPVTPKYLEYAQERLDCLRADPEAARLFLRPDATGTPNVPKLGTPIVQAELARTLAAVAAAGDGAVYRGPRAEAIAKSVQRAGGLLTTADLARYRPRWRTPLEGSYRGHRVVTFPPPSAGGVTLLQTLGVLERLRPEGFAFHDAEALHIQVEALRRAFADRAAHLGDPDFVKVPLDLLLAPAHLDALAKGIDPAHATPSTVATSGTPMEPSGADGGPAKHTTHLSVVDRDGNAVALTSTNNYYFGACLVAKGTGLLLNDEMDDFSIAPLAPNVYGLVGSEANAIAPGKVPVSSMTPTLVFQAEHRDKVRLVVGSPGGSTIPTSVLQVVSNVIDGKMDIDRAVAAGRLHHQFLPDVLSVEAWGAEPATLGVLEGKGHRFRRVTGWGSVHAVAVDPSTQLRTAAADPRTEGLALGEE